MNEHTPFGRTDASWPAPPEGLNAPVGISGLRLARERAGLQTVALAAMLKVPLRRLEALEAGRFDELPDMTFARALALSVCRVLKVDPQPILADFPASAEVRLGDIERTLNEPMPQQQVSLVGVVAYLRKLRSWPAGLTLLLALLAGLLWFYLPPLDNTGVLPEPPARESVASVAQPAAVPAAGEPEALPTQPTQTTQPTQQLLPSPAPAASPRPADAAALAVAAPPVANVEPMAVQATDPVPPPPLSPAAGFAMRAHQVVWVQITGASGAILLQRSLQVGEQIVFAHDFPLSVVLGRADAVEVSLRGQPFDLTPHARNNVARFEVR